MATNKMDFELSLSRILVISGFLFLITMTLPSVAAEPPIADARVGYAQDEVNRKIIQVTPGETVYFDGSLSSDPDGDVVGYWWDFDDGNTATGVSVSHTYGYIGAYDVRLKVVDDTGQSSWIMSTVTVEVGMHVMASIKNPGDVETFFYKPGEVIEFIGKARGGTPCHEPPRYTYEWTSDTRGAMGGGDEVKIEAMYLGLGQHKITLNVTDCLGETSADSIDVVVGSTLRAEILNLYDRESWYWDRILYSDGNWDPDHHFSGDGSSILTLPTDYTRVILKEACFNDNGFIEVNGNIVHKNNNSCCSPGCRYLEMDITRYVHPGDNTIYGYAEDCCGGYGHVSAYIQIDKIPPMRCSILREFADGSSGKQLAAGPNANAKITVPMNSIVCDAKVDVGNLAPELEIRKTDAILDIGGDGVEWSHDDFVGWDVISDINTHPKITEKLTSLLEDCNCPGCLRDGDYCTIDLKFTTNPRVNLTLRDIYILHCADITGTASSKEESCPSCQINFTARARGGLPPYDIKWVSVEEGVIDEFWIRDESGTATLYTTLPMVPPLTEGSHSIKFEITDDGGSRASDIRREVFTRWCCALDTSCHTKWPKHQGLVVNTGNEEVHSCDMYEICHPDLVQLAREAIFCCRWNCTPSFCERTRGTGGVEMDMDLSCRQGYEYGAELGLTPEGLTPDGIKRCAAVYLINGFGPTAKYMSDYWWPEICCMGDRYHCCMTPWGIGECCCNDSRFPYIIHPVDLYKCRCRYHVYTRNAQALSCGAQIISGMSPRGWRSDTAMNKNSCMLSDLPAHASILGDQGVSTEAEGINTGTCCDYSNALTTMLRIIGYGPDEVYSCTGYDPLNYGGHCYNMIKFPGESPRNWHLVDTSGNKEIPWSQHGLPPSVYSYCNYFDLSCRNDNGTFPCPPGGDVYGCS